MSQYKVCCFCLKEGHLSHACPILKKIQEKHPNPLTKETK